jgi:hypothetical protein
MRSLWPSMTSNSEAPASPLVRGRLRAFAQRPVAVRHDPHMDRQSILRCPWWAGTAGMLGRRTWLTRSSLRLPSFRHGTVEAAWARQGQYRGADLP